MSRTTAPFQYKHEEWIAGHGDVLKHVVLMTVIQELQKLHTDEGILLVDCHAGEGVYDLNQHVKPQAYQKGIIALLQAYEHNPSEAPTPVQHYVQELQRITGCTNSTDLDVYIGSPILGQNLLRPNLDEHRLLDLNVEEIQWLKLDDSSTAPTDFRPLCDTYDPEMMEFILPYTGGEGTKHPILLLDPNYDTDPDYGRVKTLISTILDQHPMATVIVTIPQFQNHKFRWSYATGLRDLAKTMAKIGRYYCSITIAKDGYQGDGILVINPTPNLDDVLDDHCIHWLALAMNMGKDEFVVEQTMKKKNV